MGKEKKSSWGVPARIGTLFNSELEDIKIERIKKGMSVKKISTEKITNLIIRHKEEHWKNIKQDIINLKEEELEKLWD